VFGFALGSSLSDPTVGYPSWNFDLLSTVAYFGLHVLWDGSFQNDAGLAVWNSSQLTKLVQVAHAHGTKVVVTIINGDASGTYPNAMCDGLLHMVTTVKNTVAEVKAKGVDGVNVDYEGVNQACNTSDPSWTRHALTRFVQSLRSALGSSYYLSIDTYSGAAGDPVGFFDVPGLNPYVDAFFVMAYDMEYSNFSHAPTNCGHLCLGPTSPLAAYYYNDTTVMAQYSAAVTPAKVILGVPYYGRKACVAGTNEYQHPIGAVAADSYLNASGEATDPSVRPGSYVIHRDGSDPAGQERWDTWYSTTLGCTRELFWDDPVSLGLKYDLANRDKLRGVGIWNLNYGGGAPELWSALASRFGGWTARYDMTKAPTGWGVGETQTFPVTVTNTGTQVWPATGYNAVQLDLHFAKSAGGSLNQKAWLSSRTFSLPHDVSPGQSVTLNATVTAPGTPGTVLLEAEMIKEHQFWFQQWQPVTVDVSTWAASFDMTKVPTSWVVGHSQTFQVTVTNTGGFTWPSTGFTKVDLDLHFSTRAGGSAEVAYWLNSKAFPLPANVAPGGKVTLTVTFAAPRTGSLVLEAEMIKEHQFWFKQWAPVKGVVAPVVWSAAYDMSKAPRTWTLLHNQTFTVTVTNTGNVTWPSTGYQRVDLDLHFTSRTGGSATAPYWLTSKAYSLPANVAPGHSVTVSVTLAAPPRSGSMFLEAEMVKEHQFWLKQHSAVTVVAAPPGWSATYNITHVPTSWVAGKPQTFLVSVTNNGTETWPATGYTQVDLNLHFATSAGGAANEAHWLSSKTFSLPKNIAPGHSVTVQVTMVPPRSGSLVLELGMIKEHQFWFPQYTAVSVTVAT
jgi:spore germination protein YaaH